MTENSQSQLAERIGKTRALLSYIEKTGKVNYFTLKDIAEALGVKMSDIEEQEANENLLKSNYPETSNITDSQNAEIDALKREISILKELIEKQNRIIQLLEKKKK